MRASTTVLGLVALFTSTTLARPASDDDTINDDIPAFPAITDAPELDRRGADKTAAWVSVDDDGQPAATLTPSITTEDGTTQIIDAAPHDITASVFTSTYYGKVTTSTGEPPNPSATGKNGEGAFARCYQDDKDADYAKICTPSSNSTLYQDTTYFVTWDPDYFNQTDLPKNTTLQIRVRLDYLNRTTAKEAPNYSSSDDFDDAGYAKLDETDAVDADWGYLPLKIKSSYLKGSSPHNITLTLMLSEKGSSGLNRTSEAMSLLFEKHTAPTEEAYHVKNLDLIIALPVTIGSIVLLAIGICIWNRKTRRIELGNIMSRSRKGYTGRKARRLFTRNRDNKDFGGAIRLDEHDGNDSSVPLYEYSDHTSADGVPGPRRDSDLGSLAGSPLTPNFRDEDTSGGRTNAFREELRRQDDEARRARGVPVVETQYGV